MGVLPSVGVKLVSRVIKNVKIPDTSILDTNNPRLRMIRLTGCEKLLTVTKMINIKLINKINSNFA